MGYFPDIIQFGTLTALIFIPVWSFFNSNIDYLGWSPMHLISFISFALIEIVHNTAEMKHYSGAQTSGKTNKHTCA